MFPSIHFLHAGFIVGSYFDQACLERQLDVKFPNVQLYTDALSYVNALEQGEVRDCFTVLNVFFSLHRSRMELKHGNNIQYEKHI